MASPVDGRTTIEYLIDRGRLERVDDATAREAADAVLGRAERRLLTAEGGLNAGDREGAFAASYDAYRMAAEALLVCQGLRATGGDGSHVTVEDAIGGQYGSLVVALAKPTFERFRRMRHTVQYFDPSAAEISDDDAAWALATARSVVESVDRVLATDPPDRFP